MKKLTLISSLLCSALVFGCGDDGPKSSGTSPTTTPNTTDGTDSDSTTGNSTDGTGPNPTSTTATTPGTATDPGGSSGGTGMPFIMMTDMIIPPMCDVWSQDCPDGQKCAPASLDGDNSWETLVCVAIDPMAGSVGDPCTAEGISGVDTCELGAMCWNISQDTGMGTCIEQCKGTEQAPTCTDPMTTCVIANDGVLTICLPNCDPLLQECPNNDLCIANPQGSQGFVCVLDASGEEGQAWDVCGYANACDPGNFCNDPALAPEYCDPMGQGCCIPFCDVGAPDCPPAQMGMPNQEVMCLPYFEMGMELPGLENLGYCGVPM